VNLIQRIVVDAFAGFDEGPAPAGGDAVDG